MKMTQKIFYPTAVIAVLLFLLQGQSSAASFDCGAVVEGTRLGTDLTADKPQSKCWHHAGKWWAVLNPGTELRLFEFNGMAWTQHLTLAEVNSTRCDCLPVGDSVYILACTSNSTRVFKLVFSDGQYGFAPGWDSPIDLPLQLSRETATIARDSTGVLWVATTEASKVNVYHSGSDERTWAGPFTVQDGIDSDDICLVTQLAAGSIGLLWSDQIRGEFGFATHNDREPVTAWNRETVASGRSMADDHLNVALASDGTLYAAVKTEFDTNGKVQLGLFCRAPGGFWSEIAPITILSSTDTGTRPIVLLNEQAGEIYVFFTNWADKPYTISVKSTRTDTLEFPRESIRLLRSTVDLNNVSSTKQTVNRDTGLVFLASPSNERSIDYCYVRDFSVLMGDSGIRVWDGR